MRPVQLATLSTPLPKESTEQHMNHSYQLQFRNLNESSFEVDSFADPQPWYLYREFPILAGPLFPEEKAITKDTHGNTWTHPLFQSHEKNTPYDIWYTMSHAYNWGEFDPAGRALFLDLTVRDHCCMKHWTKSHSETWNHQTLFMGGQS